ncbi:hypothetical protein B0J13DRAFT_664793 [Dactylonectria estremocensis]|uniref:Uncharacterized protein n=1 Tax=Dactylonectria estremocensis TaxID=1079267 RepID=A0A9P9EXL0_9HYPO|nr:hypothetical protein B0J13DRAFT_664793 [Dactylonectria estremocensis]
MAVDDRDAPHADSVVVDALYGFKVEEWDWKRIDNCSDFIYESSLDVREASLYALGNNAVLMGWASADGLGNRDKFQKLEKFNLFTREGLGDDLSLDDENGAKGRDLEVKIGFSSSEFLNSEAYLDDNYGIPRAQLICSLCPDAKLYIARLEELPTMTGRGRHVTAKSAAKIPSEPDMTALNEAIQRANNNKILMFCSASDQTFQDKLLLLNPNGQKKPDVAGPTSPAWSGTPRPGKH